MCRANGRLEHDLGLLLLAGVVVLFLAPWAQGAQRGRCSTLPAIEPGKTATYRQGPWRYHLRVRARGSRSEGRWGYLFHAGASLRGDGINDYHDTPWGRLYWTGLLRVPWGDHRWMSAPRAGKAAGRRLDVPGAQSVKKLKIEWQHKGKTVAVSKGEAISLRLGGNPSTGYRWILDEIDGAAVRKVGESFQRGGKGLDGEPGAYVFALEAVSKGQAILRLSYRRPWAKKAPDTTFVVTIKVHETREAP